MTCSSCGVEAKRGAHFCPSCGKLLQELQPIQVSPPLPQALRVVRNPMSRKARIVYSSLALILFSVFTFIFANHLPGGAHPVIANQPDVAMSTMYMGQTIEAQPITVDVQNGKLSFPLYLLLEKKMVSFEYRTATGKLPLLAYISSNGKLVTSIRICEPCNS